MSSEFLDFVEDILDAMDKAEIAVTGVEFSRFTDDFIINFAVARANRWGSCQANSPGSERGLSGGTLA